MIKGLRLIGFTKNTIGVFIVNWFFQRILRINSRFPYLIHFSNKITNPEKVVLYGEGYHTQKCILLNGGMYFGGSNRIRIHKSCLMANSVKIISGNHDFNSFDDQSIKENPIIIEKIVGLEQGQLFFLEFI